MIKVLFCGVGVALLLVAGFWLFAHDTGETWELGGVFDREPETYTLLFTGDIMLDRSVAINVERHGNGDPAYPFARISDTLKEADLTIGNLEGPISDKGVNVGSIYSFRMDPKYIEGLTASGFDVLSLANNHMFDYTTAALVDSVDRLNAAGIGTTGAGRNYEEANAAHIETLSDGTRVAFLSYTNLMPDNMKAGHDSPGLSDDNVERIKSAITTLKQENDLVVLLWHWGDEYQPTSHPREQAIARGLIDAGADLIVGHHPHVAQEIEEYNGKYIAYSLGNFIFDQYFSEETMRGLMLNVAVKDKHIISAEPINIQLTDTYQPYVVQ